jgi:3-isopropylmalate/(R)-2-methylmalate dehydratase large subunit
MPQTLAEKIIGEHLGREVRAGESVVVPVDLCFAHDASGPLVIRQLKALGRPVKEPGKVVFFIDHAVPSPRQEVANEQQRLRAFAQEAGVRLHEAGRGICHQVVAEEYAAPGQLIVGGDSHTVTAGALGAFATGMGATDVAVAMALGKTWLRVPETIRVEVRGALPRGVYGKDLVLYVIGLLGADGANYMALEWGGQVVSQLPMSERLTITNMAVEAGAKAGLMASDEETRRYLKSRGRGDQFRPLGPDKGADYTRVLEVDAARLEPQVAHPHQVDNVRPLSKSLGIPIDQVFLGSCTNARIEDLRVAARILEGRSLKARLIVTPASSEVYRQAVREGLLEVFLEVGAVVTPPGCGACFGALGGVPADAERVFSTSNRNFRGRMGNPQAEIYLGSPATAAATAVEGRIADPRDYL